MRKFIEYFKNYFSHSIRSRKFLLDEYHFNLTAFEGDVSEWLVKFPVEERNVEIHFALAELFRRRGEFDKAVSVHQAIAQAKLKDHSSVELNLEIAQDYYSAGVLGHAEEVLIDVIDGAEEEFSIKAFRLWLSILESEQDWARAVELVEQYGIPGSGGLRLVNLYCEYAQQIKKNQSSVNVHKVLKKARRLGLGARAGLLSAELATQQNKIKDAIRFYREILIRDPLRVNLVLPAIKHLSYLDDSPEKLLNFLEHLYQSHPSVRILEFIVDILTEKNLKIEPTLLKSIEYQVSNGRSFKLIQYWLDNESLVPEKFRAILEPALRRQSLSESDSHLCTECGFRSEQMLWQCPQCESWETLYSAYEIEISQNIRKHV